VSATVVVGAAGALGRAAVQQLAHNGHELVLVGRSLAALEDLAAEVPGARAIACDVTSDDDVATLAAQVGPVRMLVYLPAAPTAGGIDQAPIEAILAAVDVKVGGLLRLIRSLTPDSATPDSTTPDSAAPDRAVAVVVGGNLAYDPIPHAATSGIANAAQANAVRQLQLSATNWRLHVVAPGPVATERWEQLAAAEAEKRGTDIEAIRVEQTASSPLGRLTEPEEVAWAITMLADPKAAALHGSTLLLDTGRRTAIP
jgi:NAD(P)-dependent dehydrogenase (short-subunit alcohol dehydrogenase family)